MSEIKGFCDEQFAPLREAFEKCFKEHDDVVASFAVTKDGEYVADLWGGYLDQERTRPWLEGTIVNVSSSTKTMMAVVKAQTPLANRGSGFGVDLLSADGAARIFDEQSNGDDLVLGIPVRFGMGYGLNVSGGGLGPNTRVAYWGGWGGSLVVLDQDLRLCMSYVMNKMNSDTTLGDLRGIQLVFAAYSCVK